MSRPPPGLPLATALPLPAAPVLVRGRVWLAPPRPQHTVGCAATILTAQASGLPTGVLGTVIEVGGGCQGRRRSAWRSAAWLTRLEISMSELCMNSIKWPRVTDSAAGPAHGYSLSQSPEHLPSSLPSPPPPAALLLQWHAHQG